MKTGKLFVFVLGKSLPNFRTDFCGGPNDFPASTVFNFQEFRKTQNYRPVTRKGEEVVFQGDNHTFIMHDNFQILFLADYENEEEIERVLHCIPHSKDMAKYIVETIPFEQYE